MLIGNNPFSSMRTNDDICADSYTKYTFDGDGVRTGKASNVKIDSIESYIDDNYPTNKDNDIDVDLYNSFSGTLKSKYNCVYNTKTDTVIYGNNIYDPVANASTTKIMTCIIALEYGNLRDKVTVSPYAASMPDVQLNMVKGDEFVLEDLLYSLMLESHNDTAVAIAEHIGGSVEGFAVLMNNKAKQLGCVNTNFVTPNGLDDDMHHTCAYDLCKIAGYALQNEKFTEIVNTPAKTISNVSGTRTYSLSNHDAFLNMYKGAIGVKTGFTSRAGYCFVGAVKNDDTVYTSCVLACGWPPDKSFKWDDTKKLFDYALENEYCVSSLDEKDVYSMIYDRLSDIYFYGVPDTEHMKIDELVTISTEYTGNDYTVSSKDSIKYEIYMKDNMDLVGSKDGDISPAGLIVVKNDEEILSSDNIYIVSETDMPQLNKFCSYIYKIFFQCN